MDTDYHDAYRAFLDAHPSYAGTASLDDLRASDYERLDRLGHVYLDYTGGGLYAMSQIRAHHDQLRDGVFGNPHSNNPTSLASSALVQHARSAVLAFLNADPDESGVIFTPNASGAPKLVGESYPFEPGDRYFLTYDNHNSVNGLREFARHRTARVQHRVLPAGAGRHAVRREGESSSWRYAAASPSAPGVSATPGTAKWRTGSPARTWPSASSDEPVRSLSRNAPKRSAPRREDPRTRCASRSVSPPTSPTSSPS